MSTPLAKNELRLDIIIGVLWAKRRLFLLPCLATGIITYLLMLGVPRTYTANVMLAPEYDVPTSGGGLSSLASLANINIGSVSGGGDALVPQFYPDLMESTDFAVPLLDVKVSTKDGKFSGTYRQYLEQHATDAWWSKAMNTLAEKLRPQDEAANGRKAKQGIDPFMMSRREKALVDAVTASILCDIDRKTDVISITTTAQDPLVAAQLAEAVREKLQAFITDYRTRKARLELDHILKLKEKAYADYQKKQKQYAAYSDAHQDVVLAEYRVKAEDLENELQIAYNAYSSAKSQEISAQSKLMQRTPAFTTLQNATVPLKPTGPKRTMFALVMMMLCFLIESICLIVKYKDEYVLAQADAPQTPAASPTPQAEAQSAEA